ncbi:MAG: GNAT family N-acetyltransferase [Inquilinus sp.]|nr:GNAT family N-acetyltransferase [Inquilinus sp.]
MSGTSPDPSGSRPITIRAGTPADADAILAVHRRSILQLGRAVYSDAEVESWAHGLTADRYVRAMGEEGTTFLLAIDAAARVIGFCSLKDDVVRGLYVDPSCPRSGIGRTLLQRAEAEIVAAGHKTVRVQASLAGRPFYEAQGYEIFEEHDWKSRGGLEIAVAEMIKTIAGPS